MMMRKLKQNHSAQRREGPVLDLRPVSLLSPPSEAQRV